MHPVFGNGEKRQCGIDEAGRGPVIGPLIVSIVCGDRDLLKNLGVRDSKELTPARRERIAVLIEENAKFNRSLEISAPELNTKMESMTLNQIEEEAVIKLLGYADCETYVDCFDVNEERGSRVLSADFPFKVHCIHEADKYIPAVSAASILSKVARDSRMLEIEEEYGKMGSGYPSDPRTVSFLEKAISENRNLDDIVRKKWKTYTAMKKKISQNDLFKY